jgi:hypothetical protein
MYTRIIWRSTAWASRQPAHEGNNQASAHGRNGVRHVALRPERRSLGVDNRRALVKIAMPRNSIADTAGFAEQIRSEWVALTP